MGSTSWGRDTSKSVKQELDDHFGLATDGKNRIVKSITKGGVYYAVCKGFSDPDTTFAIVAPYETYREGGYPHILAKDQDESCGPYDVNFPVAWLDELSEPCNDYSREWRQRVRENAGKQKKRPQPGQVVRFNRPITFTDGREFSEFEVQRWGRKGRGRVYSPIGTNRLYRLDKYAWIYREWEIVEARS